MNKQQEIFGAGDVVDWDGVPSIVRNVYSKTLTVIDIEGGNTFRGVPKTDCRIVKKFNMKKIMEEFSK